MLKQRIITALILAPLTLAAIFYLPTLPFALLIALVLILAGWEWANLIALSRLKRLVFLLLLLPGIVAGLSMTQAHMSYLWLAVLLWVLLTQWVLRYPNGTNEWGSGLGVSLMGLCVINAAAAAIILLHRQTEGAALIVLLLLMVWGADIGAYFSGRAWGKRKLAPNVSPGKTWAGAWGGVASTALIACLAGLFFDVFATRSMPTLVALLLLALITATISIMGDLTESMVKRHRGVKDSGNLLPGHGGILDRVDSLLAALPVYTLALNLLGLI